jgi:hypothetical protein
MHVDCYNVYLLIFANTVYEFALKRLDGHSPREFGILRHERTNLDVVKPGLCGHGLCSHGFWLFVVGAKQTKIECSCV